MNLPQTPSRTGAREDTEAAKKEPPPNRAAGKNGELSIVNEEGPDIVLSAAEGLTRMYTDLQHQLGMMAREKPSPEKPWEECPSVQK